MPSSIRRFSDPGRLYRMTSTSSSSISSVCVVSLGGIISRTQQNTANVVRLSRTHLICMRGSYHEIFSCFCCCLCSSQLFVLRSTPALCLNAILAIEFALSLSTRPAHLCAFIISTTVTLYITHSSSTYSHTQTPRTRLHSYTRIPLPNNKGINRGIAR